MQRSDSLEKTLMPGIDSRQDEKGMAENELVGWQYWLNRHEFEQLQGLVMNREACYVAGHGVTKIWHDWPTEENWIEIFLGEWDIYVNSGSSLIKYAIK